MHAGRAAWTVQRYRRVRTRALRLLSRGGEHGVRVRPGAGGKPVLLPNWWSPPRPASRPRRGRQRSRKPGPRAPLRAVVVTQIYWLRCRRVAGLTRGTARVCLGEALGSRPAWNTIREAISRDTPSGPRRLHAFRKNRTRSAAGTFSGHRQRSRRICHQR